MLACSFPIFIDCQISRKSNWLIIFCSSQKHLGELVLDNMSQFHGPWTCTSIVTHEVGCAFGALTTDEHSLLGSISGHAWLDIYLVWLKFQRDKNSGIYDQLCSAFTNSPRSTYLRHVSVSALVIDSFSMDIHFMTHFLLSFWAIKAIIILLSILEYWTRHEHNTY